MNTIEKIPVKELGSSRDSTKASPGKFKACVMIDSCVYQIKDEVDTREEALELCDNYRGMDHGVQIFDDKNEAQLEEGKLKAQ